MTSFYALGKTYDDTLIKHHIISYQGMYLDTWMFMGNLMLDIQLNKNGMRNNINWKGESGRKWT